MITAADAITMQTELAVNCWTDAERAEIALEARYCWGSCHGDDDPGCGRVERAVLAGGPELAWYGPIWVHDRRPWPAPIYDDDDLEDLFWTPPPASSFADALRDESARQIRERQEGYDDTIDQAVLRAALLVLERRLAGSPSDAEAHDVHDRLERYLAQALSSSGHNRGSPQRLGE